MDIWHNFDILQWNSFEINTYNQQLHSSTYIVSARVCWIEAKNSLITIEGSLMPHTILPNSITKELRALINYKSRSRRHIVFFIRISEVLNAYVKRCSLCVIAFTPKLSAQSHTETILTTLALICHHFWAITFLNH